MINIVTENQMLTLFEERGVAISPWKKEIDAIAMYIRQEVKLLLEDYPLGETLSFTIPKDYLTKFNFLKNPQININAIYSNDNTHFGEGKYRNGKVTFFKKRLKNTLITIGCYYNSEGKVWLNTVLKTLYHEFNHAYEAWINGQKDKIFKRFNKSANKGILGNKIEELNKSPYIGECIYRLFSETEYNALVASVFGDLQGIDGDFTTFQEDYKKTVAYKVFIDLMSNLETEINGLSKEDCQALMLLLKKYNISINTKDNTVRSFKIGFMTKANRLLSKLIKDIGRVASFYYDKKNEDYYNNTNNLIIK